ACPRCRWWSWLPLARLRRGPLAVAGLQCGRSTVHGGILGGTGILGVAGTASKNRRARRERRPAVKVHQRRSWSTFWVAWLAWASIAVPACCRIWLRESCADSLAKSASWIRLRAADRFSTEVDRLATTEVKRFCTAPISA